jgi:hypothetical protein
LTASATRRQSLVIEDHIPYRTDKAITWTQFILSDAGVKANYDADGRLSQMIDSAGEDYLTYDDECC